MFPSEEITGASVLVLIRVEESLHFCNCMASAVFFGVFGLAAMVASTALSL